MSRLFDILRIALGAIMAATAVDYFLPDLLPIVTQYEFTDPMSIELMSRLEASGLLAVAKFIQLTGGLALLLNRAVPFALAAMVCVNVCVAFIALIIEGNALLALMALAVLALNAALMFAYLPAYSGLLAAGELSDGEGAEAGEHFNSLFCNPLSGASRKALLIGLIPLLGALWFFWKVVPFANGTMGLYVLILPSLVWIIGMVKAKS